MKNSAVAQSCSPKVNAPVGHACPYRNLASPFIPEFFVSLIFLELGTAIWVASSETTILLKKQRRY
jgi:hypothetical protein